MAQTPNTTEPGSTTIQTIGGGNPPTPGTGNTGGTVINNPPPPPITPTHTWQNGITRQTEVGYPPTNWILKADGFWYPPADTPTGTGDIINLSEFITITPDPSKGFGLTYIKGSGMQVPTQTYTISNIAQNMSIIVTINAIDGVTVQPQSFELMAAQTVEVDITFTPGALESLPEGLNSTSILVNLAPGSVTVIPNNGGISGPPISIIPPVPGGTPVNDGGTSTGGPVILPPPPPPITQPSWNNGLTRQTVQGSPPSGWTLNSDGFWYPPATNATASIDFSFSELAPTVLPKTGAVTMNGALTAIVNNDAVTNYTFSWNFDVLSQGQGTQRSATLSAPVVGWPVTIIDQKNLNTQSSTTRTVELIATKGAQTYRTRKVITFSSAALLQSIATTGGLA